MTIHELEDLCREAIRLAEAATKGPWYVSDDGYIVQTSHVTRDVWTIPHKEDDLPFIAHARNSVPTLARCLLAAILETQQVVEGITGWECGKQTGLNDVRDAIERAVEEGGK